MAERGWLVAARVAGKWVYVYRLIEFQSQVDPWMVLRVMVYTGLRYQNLIDAGRIGTAVLAPVGSVAAELVRLETLAKDGPAALRPILHRLTVRLQGARYDSLRRALTVWFVRVLLRRLMPGENLPEIHELLEVETMLAEHVDEWTEKWKREGKLEGKLEGKTDSLKRVLIRRFGDLPAWASERIEAATLAQLDAWLDGIFTAETLDVLLGGASPERNRPAG